MINTNHVWGIKSLFLVAATLSLWSCSGTVPSRTAITLEAHKLIEQLETQGGVKQYLLPEAYALQSLPQDTHNPLTAGKVKLGEWLFHETALSFVSHNENSGTWSCASCHFASAGFQDQRMQSLADGGVGNGRERHILNPEIPHARLDSPNLRSPSILNLGYQHNILWNGMAGGVGDNLNYQAQWTKSKPHGFNFLNLEGVETQAIIALGVHRQTHDVMTYESAHEPLSYLDQYPEYQRLFEQEFPGQPISRKTIGLAIAAYERTVLSNEAPFQAFLKGNHQALYAEELRGAQLFFGKAQCATCHTGPALNQENYYALGLKDMNVEFGPSPDEATRKGRGGFTQNPEDDYKFKVPQLYNLKSVGSLGHGGSFQSDTDQSALEKIIRYKLKGVPENPEVPSQQLAPAFTAMAQKQFSEDEIRALVRFVQDGLYDAQLRRYEPRSLPSRQHIINHDH